MGDRAKKAQEYFQSGYNCSQAVALAFADRVGMDEDTVVRSMAAFGGGMGRMREVCGAFSGSIFILGLLEGSSDPSNTAAKRKVYEDVQKLAEGFREQEGSIICGELLGTGRMSHPKPAERNAAYYKKRPCGTIVYDAARRLEEYLEKTEAEEGQ